MNKLHKLTLLSFLVIIAFFLLFLFFAENNYTGFDSYTKYNLISNILNYAFAVILLANIILSFLSLLNFFIESLKRKKITIKTIFFGIYPITLICILSSFNLSVFMRYLISPFEIFFNIIK